MEEADPNKDEVFISGLPLDITEKEIAEYFGQIGIIKEVSKIIGTTIAASESGGGCLAGIYKIDCFDTTLKRLYHRHAAG